MIQNFKVELIVSSTLSYLETDNVHSASVEAFSKLGESTEFVFKAHLLSRDIEHEFCLFARLSSSIICGLPPSEID